MTKDQLMESLASYGYPLLLPASDNSEKLLENLLAQDDMRLLEGFPVVFANMLKENRELKWEKNDWNPNLFSSEVKKRLPVFLALTLLLLQFNKVGKSYEERVEKILFRLPGGKNVFDDVALPFAKSEPVKFDGVEFSTERLLNTFKTYMFQFSQNKDFENKKHNLELELLLSEIFTPRQKVLLRKKSEKTPLTKTEREYFSRVVKKRLKVLANDELHQLAHHLLQENSSAYHWNK